MNSDELKIKNKTVVFAGGGTGGHLWPLVSIVRRLRSEQGITPVYFGTGSALERRVWRKERVRQIKIPSGKRRGYFSLLNFIDTLLIPVGFLKAFIWLLAYKPAFVFGKGGYGMLPTVMAARLLNILVIAHESDIVMGRANRKVLDWGGIVLTAFPSSVYELPQKLGDRVRYAGMIIHPGLYSLKKNKQKSRKTILIFGGSQGAERINRLVAPIWSKIAEMGEVIHITGPANIKRYKDLLAREDKAVRQSVKLFAETDKLPEFIVDSSVIICRSGSTSLWEVAVAGVPAVTVPLPESMNDHQRLNALWLSQEFPFISVREEKNLDPEKLLLLIKNKLNEKSEQDDARSLIMPDESLGEIGNIAHEALLYSYFSQKHAFHLVGSEGVSMKGIARVLRQMGDNITGSDLTTGGHKAENIQSGVDAVIYSSAAAQKNAPGNVELEYARGKNIPTIKRSKFIADIVNVKKLIAVSGMHGKSTTSSMAAHIFRSLGLDPSYLIGVPEDPTGSNAAHWGSSNIAVLEACEYDRSFNDFYADVITITNIEAEHLDYFRGGIKEIENAFVDFINQARPNASLIVGEKTQSIRNVIKKVADMRPDIKVVSASYGNINKKDYNFFGEHNFEDAALAVAVAEQFGIKANDAWSALRDFSGAKRRMEYIGEYNGAAIYDDYGHHPTEIAATLKALKQKDPKRNVLLVFQPHQVNRTKTFFKEFVQELSKADKVIITDIYEVAGREDSANVSSAGLVEAINKKSKEKATYIPLPYEKIVQYLENHINSNDIVLIMGATNIFKVAHELVNGKPRN